MLKGDENWFEMNMILSKFGGDSYVSMLDKNKKKRVNINGNRGPWKSLIFNVQEITLRNGPC